MQLEALQQIVIDALEDLKAQNITVLDVRNIASFTDLMIIADATADPELLGGRYALRRAIGSGGMAQVHAADDLETATALADSLEDLAEVHCQLGDHDLAMGCYEELINIRRRLADQAADDQETATALKRS